MPHEEPRLVLVERRQPDLEQRDDDELMQLSAAGLCAAFELLTRRHQASLRRYCARRCPGTGDEVAQEVLLALWAARRDYQPRGQFRAYLFTLAERRCSNATRGQRRALRRELASEQTSCDPPLDTPLDALLAQERQRRLFELVDQLAPDKRRAIFLRYAAGLDYEEIADLTERSEATVRTRVFSGLVQLRKLLTKRSER